MQFTSLQVAPKPHPPVYAPPRQANNCIYYFNSKTGESLWEPPKGEDFSSITVQPAKLAPPAVNDIKPAVTVVGKVDGR